MKFYFPHDVRISRAMERVRQGFIKHKPVNVEFVDKPTTDSIHFLNWIGQNPKEHTKICEETSACPTLPVTQKYILLLHGAGNPHYPQHQREFEDLLRNAMLIVTFFKEYAEGIGNVYETPWGYDPSIFYKENDNRFRKIICTGYVANMESIDSVKDACTTLGVSWIHVGGRLGAEYIHAQRLHHFKDITDTQMRQLYNECEYVSGMRKGGIHGGFELPNIEGYVCGCQPICHINPISMKYFEDFAVFLPELPRKELAARLVEVLRIKPMVTSDPAILERFKWKNIAPNIWKRLMES